MYIRQDYSYTLLSIHRKKGNQVFAWGQYERYTIRARCQLRISGNVLLSIADAERHISGLAFQSCQLYSVLYRSTCTMILKLYNLRSDMDQVPQKISSSWKRIFELLKTSLLQCRSLPDDKTSTVNKKTYKELASDVQKV